MMRYSVQTRDQIFVKGYGFLSFAKNISKNIGNYPIVTLSTQDNAKPLDQLKTGFKRTINWNKYQSKESPERINQYSDFLIEIF